MNIRSIDRNRFVWLSVIAVVFAGAIAMIWILSDGKAPLTKPAENLDESEASALEGSIREKREAYLEAVGDLSRGNFSTELLDQTLRSEDRAAALDRLAESNTAIRDQLGELAQAFDALEQAGAKYREANENYGRHSIEQLEDQPEIVEALLQAEDQFFESRDRYGEMERNFRATHYFDPLLFDHLVALRDDTRPSGQSEARQAAPREERLAALKVRYPDLSDRLQAAYDALLAYEKICNRFDAPRSLIQMPARPGVLEFRIAADPSEGHQDEIDRLDNHGIEIEPDQPYRWFSVDDLGRYITDADSRAQIEQLLTRSLSTDVVEAQNARDAVSEFMRDRRQVVARPYAGGLYLLLHDDPGFAMTRQLQWGITTVGSGLDQLGRPTVNFELDGRGALLMADMTGRNTNRPMAVLLDGSILTAPIINERLSMHVQISGDFSTHEVDYLIHAMSLGSP